MAYRNLQGLNNPQLSDLIFSPTDSLPFTHTSLLPIPWACQIFVSNDCYLGMLSSLISLIWLVIVITEISACVSSRGECSSMHTLLWTLPVSAVSFIILAYLIDFILPIIIWSHCFWFSCFKIIIIYCLTPPLGHKLHELKDLLYLFTTVSQMLVWYLA